MGYYIETKDSNKVKEIVNNHGGRIIIQPEKFEEIQMDEALICVVDNYLFQAAGFCYDEIEFKAFTSPNDDRPKTWLIMNRKEAERLTGFGI